MHFIISKSTQRNQELPIFPKHKIEKLKKYENLHATQNSFI